MIDVHDRGTGAQVREVVDHGLRVPAAPPARLAPRRLPEQFLLRQDRDARFRQAQPLFQRWPERGRAVTRRRGSPASASRAQAIARPASAGREAIRAGRQIPRRRGSGPGGRRGIAAGAAPAPPRAGSAAPWAPRWRPGCASLSRPETARARNRVEAAPGSPCDGGARPAGSTLPRAGSSGRSASEPSCSKRSSTCCQACSNEQIGIAEADHERVVGRRSPRSSPLLRRTAAGSSRRRPAVAARRPRGRSADVRDCPRNGGGSAGGTA